VRFKWQSPTSGRIFNYAAIRAGGKWYTTGRESSYARPWAAFVEWLLMGKTDALELLVPKVKYDRKLAKARAADQLAASGLNANVARSIPMMMPDAAKVKDLFEDLVALREKGYGVGVMPIPIIDRVLEYALAAIRQPLSEDAAVFLAATDRYQRGMAETDKRDG
jgi:hypothetical protein